MSTSLKYNLTRDQVPKWLQFPHLTTQYRHGGNYWSCCKSLFAWHSETINAWTMICGNIFSFAALLYVLNIDQPSNINKIPFITFWLSAALHAPFSIGYHLFMPISESTCNTWRKLDISFIYITTFLLTFSLSYFTMPLCLTILFTTTSTAVATYALSKNFNNVLHRSLNVKLVGCNMIIYMMPMILTGRFLPVLASLAIGGFVYANCIPECYSHGTFDLVGRSHQIMHVCIIIAHVYEFWFIRESYIKK